MKFCMVPFDIALHALSIVNHMPIKLLNCPYQQNPVRSCPKITAQRSSPCPSLQPQPNPAYETRGPPAFGPRSIILRPSSKLQHVQQPAAAADPANAAASTNPQQLAQQQQLQQFQQVQVVHSPWFSTYSLITKCSMSECMHSHSGNTSEYPD